MSSFVIDSLKISRVLKSRGYSDNQAEGIVEVLQLLDASNLATKADLKAVEHQLESKMSSLENRLAIRFGAMMMASVAFLTAIKFFV